MKILEVLAENSKLRLILSGVITSAHICEALSPIIDKHVHFQHKYVEVIVKLCCDYYRRFNRAPNEHIFYLVEELSNESLKQDILSILNKINFSSIKEVNTEYILKLIEDYLNKSLLVQLSDKIQSDEIDQVFGELEQVRRIRLGYSKAIEPFGKDISTWIDVIDKSYDERAIITYPGALGELTEGSFARGTLYAFWGVEKAGKSFYLLDAVYRALRRKNRVAYFEVGDLGKNEVLTRLACRITRRPRRQTVVEWPISWNNNDVITKKIQLDEVSVSSALRLIKRKGKVQSLLKLCCYPNSSIGVSDICQHLHDWARYEQWFADVVVIDYADILKLPSSSKDLHERVDELWKQLRRLSQEFNCLVLTASQVGAQVYRKKPGSMLSRADFSGRKTKLAHVNGVLGISIDNIHNSVTRVNWIVRREASARGQVIVAGCFQAATPIIITKWAE